MGSGFASMVAGLKAYRSRVAVTSVVLALTILAGFIPMGWAWEIDSTDRVTYILDGDTFDTSANGRIRLADIDAPEHYESGYSEAKYALTGLIGGKTVFLDIDVTGEDPYGRLVCVVYVRHNATHVTNVNKALLDQGAAAVTDFANNEFNPSTWATYEYYPETSPPATTPSPTSSPSAPPSPSMISYPYALAAALLVALLILVLVFVLRKRETDTSLD